MTEAFGKVLADIVGERWVQQGEDIGERYRTDIMKKYSSNPGWLARPDSTEQVSAIMRAASSAAIAVTVIGGQSGTSGGAVPSDGGLALSLERMNQVLEIDTLSMTMTVEAGCILQLAQQAAEEQDAFLPVDLGARGSAMIGGVIGTNAGGNRVVRWGMMRDMVIGLEAVLADGTIVSSLTKMLKDNAGYHWKHLLVGSEGTLGIVTKAVLRLRPLPTTRQTALIATASFKDMITVMRRLERGLSGQLSSFELMWNEFYEALSGAQIAQRPRPMATGHAIYALVEAMGGNEELDTELFTGSLSALLEEGLIEDAVIAQSGRERDGLWALRDDLVGGLASMHPFISYDVSMAIADMTGFVEAATKALKQAYPEVRILFYGHAGDGNLHANVSIGRLDNEVKHGLNSAVFGAVRDVGGSISAEHGIGMDRMPWLSWTRSESELALMRSIKLAIDPAGILNPGKLLPAAPDGR